MRSIMGTKEILFVLKSLTEIYLPVLKHNLRGGSLWIRLFVSFSNSNTLPFWVCSFRTSALFTPIEPLLLKLQKAVVLP
jgi:hypothetical protein